MRILAPIQYSYNSRGTDTIALLCQHPFGSIMEGRWYEADALWYRFSMNGQEKDDEIYGKGNATSAEFWEYDGRLGR